MKELVLKREEHKRQKKLVQRNATSRTPTPEVVKKSLDSKQEVEIQGEEHFLYSSALAKTGKNMPPGVSHKSYMDTAMNINKNLITRRLGGIDDLG